MNGPRELNFQKEKALSLLKFTIFSLDSSYENNGNRNIIFSHYNQSRSQTKEKMA